VHAIALRTTRFEERLDPLLDDEKEGVRLRTAAGFLRLSAIETAAAHKRALSKQGLP